MIYYDKEKKELVIPAVFEGDGNGCETAVEEAIAEGKIIGYSSGYTQGEIVGKEIGFTSGWTAGYNQGQEDCPECNLEQKSVVIDETNYFGHVIRPSSGYEGLSQVSIDATDWTNDMLSSGRTEGFASGWSAGFTSGETRQKSLLTYTTIINDGTYERENGWNRVVVAVEPKIVSLTLSEYEEMREAGTLDPNTYYNIKCSD